ncbi:serine/threonine-protein kinase AtPK1/AtPK6-like [Andrographis paniculata]|uniref:serine/threonine-protein kinase AtPK1/AtPK6-like n=1 Tax=Andrographis paniculata TaxID=175694 RepID=UPI0021E9552E|nr:serine/threonine-protein kinase AtPK1/AtPK6-like [Andrographis paniculata]
MDGGGSNTLSSSSSTALQKKAAHTLLASRLTNLRIPPSGDDSSQDFDFSDLFGAPPAGASPPASSSSHFVGDPPIIHNRSHSFVGPSPRFTLSKSLPNFEPDEQDELAYSSSDNGDSKVELSEKEDGGVGIDRELEDEVRKLGPADFEIMRVIGKGAFGKVFQVKMKGRDGDGGDGCDGDGIYAMKVMRKDTIIRNNHVDYMRAERDILTKVVHPFIVQLRYSFQTKSKLYLILDFINGGHLFYHLYRQGIFSEDQARVYTSEIVSAVSHLHKSGIVHRDLKPENILMDAYGHVMLTDFGLAKEIDESSRSNSMCGTTEYMAPEILLAKGHNKNADWWSVGILLYEMLTGQPPYTHTNRKKLQEKIINEKLKLPPRLTSEAHSLLKGLLQKDPSKRLGSGSKGAEEIKSHKWFRTINWKKLETREILPKFKPDVSGQECTANFDHCWTAMPADDSPAPTPTSGEHFPGYTYVAPTRWLPSQ